MIKDFSTIFWGYLPPTKEPYKVHEKVNAFIGASGHGKTTIWDGLRLMLGAGHFESKRTFSFYVHKKSNWAAVRVSFYNLPVNGVRPFELARKFKDEVTACCRIYKNDTGSWAREYYLFDGEFYDLADIQFNTKAYSEAGMNVGEYLEILERCLGITKEFRNLMAMSPDTVREVVNSSPHSLFHLIFDLKGAKDYKKRYDNSKQRLNEQEITIERAEEEMKQAQERFEESRQKAQKFRLYQLKEKEVENTKLKLKKLEYFEIQEKLKSTEEKMREAEKGAKEETSRVTELIAKIKAKQTEINDWKEEYKCLDIDEREKDAQIKGYISEKTKRDIKINELSQRINNLKQIKPQNVDELKQLKEIFKTDLNKKNLEFVQAQDRLRTLREKSAELKRDILPYKEEAKKFRKVLEERKIPFIMLADAVSVKQEMRKWQKAIEAYIGNNRYRIIIEEGNYLAAKKLQEKERYGSRVSLPRGVKEIATKYDIPYPSIRSAININYQSKVEGYLDRLSQVYLVETVEEGHSLQAKGIESITLGGLLQDSDGAIHLKYYDLCCGKLALDEEKKRTNELLILQNEINEKLKTSINELNAEIDQLTNEIQNQELLVKLPEMEDEHKILSAESQEFYQLIKETEDQKEEDRERKNEIHEKELSAVKEKTEFDEKKKQAHQKSINLFNIYESQQKEENYLTVYLEQSLVELKALGLSDDDVEFIPYDVQGSAFMNHEGNRISSKDLQNNLDGLHREKEKLYDSSVNEEIVRVVEAQEGQVELLEQNLKQLKEDREDIERTCDDLLHQFRGHIKEIMKDYIAEFESFADLLKATGKGRLVEVTPEPDTWEIQLFIGYDGKEPVAVDGPHLSSGQKASTSLMILLAALSDNKRGKTTPIMFLDEPKARVDDDRGNEIGQLLQVTDIQYFITHQQGESLKTIDWIDHSFSCSACEKGKDFANQLILKRRARMNI
ncbi:chromosome segregation protein SMC [Clostridium sp. UBA1652]|uniref:chromosome segregation protein SMC n=1 Tax=Clostridium sp. UBA1652 TaxID=1946348 RepID=UPI00257EB5E9|nr:chromosome segregation protein SMC [Clostridium sp. UBA1652]